jgi:EpsI family protein
LRQSVADAVCCGGIIWIGIQKKLHLSHKILCGMGIVPLALIINGLRLFTLVAMSHFLYKPVEGSLHELTGVAAFILGITILIAVTAALETEETVQDKGSKSLMTMSCILAIFFTFLPFFLWTFQAWKSSPVDRFGYIYVLFAAGLLFYTLKAFTGTSGNFKYFIILTLFSLLCMISSAVAEINIMLALSFFSLAGCIIYIFYGKKVFLISLPLIGLAFVGIPATAFIINKLLFLTVKKSSLGLANTGQALIALVLIAIWYLLIRKNRDEQNSDKPENSTVKANLSKLTVVLLIFLGIKLSLHSTDSFSSYNSDIKLSYIIGDWTGAQIDAPDMLQGSKTWIRIYEYEDKKVELIINASGGNRHNLHPPESCLTGSGWKISERSKSNVSFKSFGSVTVGEMFLRKGDFSRVFLHWYSDGESIYPDYLSLLAEDTKRRFQGRRTNWYLFRIMAPDRKTLTDDFLKHFQGKMLQNKMVDF